MSNSEDKKNISLNEAFYDTIKRPQKERINQPKINIEELKQVFGLSKESKNLPENKGQII